MRLILPFGPGGVADVTARIVTEKLGEKLGQRFIIENMPGAGGINAARAVLSSPADGYTLALLSNGTAISVSLFKNLKFNPVTDFVPVSSLGLFRLHLRYESRFALSDAGGFHQDSEAKARRAQCRHHQCRLDAKSLGAIVQIDRWRRCHHRSVPQFARRADRAVARRYPDGDRELHRRAIAHRRQGGDCGGIIGPVRTSFLPDVPTVKEAVGGDFEARSWNAIFAPKGTPPEVIRTLNAALREVLETPELKKRALELGIEAKASTPEEILGRLKDDIGKWAKVIERAGIAIEKQ